MHLVHKGTAKRQFLNEYMVSSFYQIEGRHDMGGFLRSKAGYVATQRVVHGAYGE